MIDHLERPGFLWGLPTVKASKKSVGACLAAGVKTVGGGYPKEKDRFHVVVAKTSERKDSGRSVDYRPHDPVFAAFNEAPLAARKVFYGELCYHNEMECWHPNYGMYRFPNGRGENPKTKRFACSGNGHQAERFHGEGDIRSMPCPGEGCPFRQGKAPPCSPRARFWFRPRWKPSQGNAFARWLPDGSIRQLLDRPIMRLATQGREARDTFSGMLAEVRETVKPFGIEINSWMGLPFSVTISESRQAAGVHPGEKSGRRWPDITFALDGDVMKWVGWQATEFKMLSGSAPVLALGAASAEETDPEAVGEEHAAIVPLKVSTVPAAKPSAVAEPAAEPVSAEPSVIEGVEIEVPDKDPRSYRQRIQEDYAGSGLTPYALGKHLRDKGLMKDGEAFAKKNSLEDHPWDNVKASVEELIEGLKPGP